MSRAMPHKAFPFELVPFSPGPYKLTQPEAERLMDRVRASMSLDQFRKSTVGEILSAYQAQKAEYLVLAAVREPLRFEAKEAGE